MLEEIVKKLQRKVEGLPIETQEQIVMRSLSLGVGVGVASLDVLTTGAPLLTFGIPIYDVLKLATSSYSLPSSYFLSPLDIKEYLKEYGKNTVAYISGAAILFAVRYHNEVMSFFSHFYSESL